MLKIKFPQDFGMIQDFRMSLILRVSEDRLLQ